MKDYFIDICNCPECHYYGMNKPHCCGLPEKISDRDMPHIREAVRTCHCVNLRLLELCERMEAGH